MAFLRRPGVRLTLAILLVLYLLSGPIALIVSRPGPAETLAAVPVGALALGCCLLALRGPAGGRNAWLLLLSLAGASVMHMMSPYTGTGFFYVAIFAAPYRTRMRLAVLVTAAALAAFLVVSLAIGLEPGPALGMSAGLAYCAVLAFLLWLVTTTRRQAAEVAEARAREAVLSERARLAREVHDILAHTQSAQIVHLEGARLLLKDDRGDRALALDRVERAVHLARSSLEETRRALDALRDEAVPLSERLERLAAEFQAATGADCALSLDPRALALPAEAGLAVVRTAQEALTNVRKHAPGASVAVAVRRRGRWCELVVRDDGGRRASAVPARNGYGLIGMRERAELLGGSLSAKSEDKGFAVVLRVPA